jgi:hypothetical protein
LRIDDGAEEFSAAGLAGTVGHARIVGENGSDAGEERIGCVAYALDLLA